MSSIRYKTVTKKTQYLYKISEIVIKYILLNNIRLMLQSSDSHTLHAQKLRAEWIAILARAPIELLEQALADQQKEEPVWLRKPETGLMMIEGRAGGTGQRFNLGEITITRCALRLAHTDKTAPVGVAYVMGRSHRLAELAAVADALFLSTNNPEFTEKKLLPIREYLKNKSEIRQQQISTSKVEFFTVARESGNNEESEE